MMSERAMPQIHEMPSPDKKNKKNHLVDLGGGKGKLHADSKDRGALGKEFSLKAKESFVPGEAVKRAENLLQQEVTRLRDLVDKTKNQLMESEQAANELEDQIATFDSQFAGQTDAATEKARLMLSEARDGLRDRAAALARDAVKLEEFLDKAEQQADSFETQNQ